PRSTELRREHVPLRGEVPAARAHARRSDRARARAPRASARWARARSKRALGLILGQGIRALERIPDLEVLVAHASVQLLGERPRELRVLDKLDHVAEVRRAMDRAEPGRELELDELRDG